MQLDISNLAYIAGDVLGIGEFAGGVFCTFALFVVTFFTLAYVLKDKTSPLVAMIDGALCVGLALALGWVDIWLPALVILVIIFYLAVKGTGGFNA